MRDTWECLYTLILEELGRTHTEALADGETPERLAEQLDERIVRLHQEITVTDRP